MTVTFMLFITFASTETITPYHKISNNLYTLLIYTPPFSGKFRTLIYLTHNNKTIVLFIQQKCKHDEMAFMTSRNASKHVLLALGVDCAARDAMKAKFTGFRPNIIFTGNKYRLHHEQGGVLVILHTEGHSPVVVNH